MSAPRPPDAPPVSSSPTSEPRPPRKPPPSPNSKPRPPCNSHPSPRSAPPRHVAVRFAQAMNFRARCRAIPGEQPAACSRTPTAPAIDRSAIHCPRHRAPRRSSDVQAGGTVEPSGTMTTIVIVDCSRISRTRSPPSSSSRSGWSVITTRREFDDPPAEVGTVVSTLIQSCSSARAISAVKRTRSGSALPIMSVTIDAAADIAPSPRIPITSIARAARSAVTGRSGWHSASSTTDWRWTGSSPTPTDLPDRSTNGNERCTEP